MSNKLRLLALPLTKSIKPRLIYFHAINPAVPAHANSYLNRATSWAGGQWDGLGNSPAGSFKHRIWRRGEKLMDQFEFEEFALKGLDHELGPKLRPTRKEAAASAPTDDPKNAKNQAAELVPFIFPKSKISAEELKAHLEVLLQNREPLHRKRMWQALLISPLTWPFALVPVIPNLPLFYVLWRAWSNWRAASASKFLLGLIERDQLKFQASDALDRIYDRADLKDSDESASGALALSFKQVELIVKEFQLDKTAETELERALVQSKNRLLDASQEKEKQS